MLCNISDIILNSFLLNVFCQHTQLHQDFVSAVFEVGLRHATPSAIIELMIPNLDMTSERVKSHLQRYRLNIVKSRNEFKLRFADIYCSINNPKVEDSEKYSLATVGAAPLASSFNEDNHLQRICLPQLSAEEKDTPLGQAFGQLLGLMHNLTVQLENNRQRQYIDSLAHTEATPQDRPSRHKHLPPTRFPSDLSTTSSHQTGGRPTIETANPHPYHLANSSTAPNGYATQTYHQHFPQHSSGDNFASSSGHNLQLQGNTMMPYQPSLMMPNQNVPTSLITPMETMHYPGNYVDVGHSRMHSFDDPMGIVHHPGNNDRLSNSDHPLRKHSFDEAYERS